MIIAVDFDGTCVTPNFPFRGVNIGAAPVLRHLKTLGHFIFAWTVRDAEYLSAIHEWEKENNFKFDAINSSLVKYSESPKCHADLFIDDMALGCPLRRFNKKKAVDWLKVVKYLVNRNVISQDYAPSLIYQVKTEIARNSKNYKCICTKEGYLDAKL